MINIRKLAGLAGYRRNVAIPRKVAWEITCLAISFKGWDCHNVYMVKDGWTALFNRGKCFIVVGADCQIRKASQK